MQLNVLVPRFANRIIYIVEWMATTHWGIKKVLLFTDQTEWEAAEGFHLNYTTQNISNYPFLALHDFMLEGGIKEEQKVSEVNEFDHLAFAFETNNMDALFPFDIFAWCFYLVSRYEEYLPFNPDQHGRFTAQQSLAYQQDFVKTPLVDLWAQRLLKKLQTYYPNWQPKKPTYKFTPSYDIDYAYAFKYKGLKRQVGAAARNLLKGYWGTLKEQLKTWLALREDPFFTFNYLQDLDQKYKLKSLYFFLVGDYGAYDKNLAYNHPKMQELIRTTAKTNPVGWHPSYQSNTNSLEKLGEEKKRLANTLEKTINTSRQHFLKLNFPDTYNRLLTLSIEEEYSMGYANTIGFRASTAHSFYWYNLEEETKTRLLVRPFQAMDVTLVNYLKWDKGRILKEVSDLIDQIYNVGGHFIMINHNNSFCELGEWKGWQSIYEQIIDYATKKETNRKVSPF